MKQKKYGKCSICGRDAFLSEDHIPPKCCGNNTDSFYIQYTPDFLETGSKKRPVHSQKGLTFSHICDNCNNEMGSKYDIHLQSFRDCFLSIIENKNYAGTFDLEYVCKAIIGHFLAASQYNPSIFANAMRDYYINNDKTIIKKYTLTCMYYPYKNCIFSLNDYIPVSTNDTEIPKGMISSLYFYPFAFLFCEKQKLILGTDLFELCANKSNILRINSKEWGNKLETWPAIVDDQHAFIVGLTMNDSKRKVEIEK